MKSKFSLFAGLLLIVCLCLANTNTAFAGSSPPNTVQTVDHTDFDCNLAIPAAPDYDVILQVPSVSDDVSSAATLNVTFSGLDAPAFTLYDLYAAPPNLKRQNDGDSESYGSLKYGYNYNTNTTGASPGNILPAPRFSPGLCGIDLDRLWHTSNVNYNLSGLALNQTCGQSARLVVRRC